MFKIKFKMYTILIVLLSLSIFISACTNQETENPIVKVTPSPIANTTSLNNIPLNEEQSTENTTMKHCITDATYETHFPIHEYTGQLGLQIDFKLYESNETDSISVIDLSHEEAGAPIILSKTDTELIKSQLHWLKFDIAKADTDKLISHVPHPILLSLTINNEQYSLVYDLNYNAFLLGCDYYYAESAIAEIMHVHFKHDSILAKLESYHQLAEQSRIKNENDSKDQSNEYRYEFERLNVNGLDYHGLYKLISKHSETEMLYTVLNSGHDTQSSILYNDDLKLLFSDGLYIFDEQFETIDGIKVGLTKADVLHKLGPANKESETVWSYRIGDYLKFHLYFVDNRLEVISLTLPL